MRYSGWIIFLLLWASLAAAGDITIVTEILPPWQTTDGRTVGGIATEIVEAALREADLEAHIEVYPWSRAYRLALEKPNVLIYSIIRTPERENQFKWVGVIGSVKEHFFHMAEREDIRLSNIKDAKKFLTIIPRDDFRHQFLVSRGFKEKIAFHLVNKQEQALRMLYAGRGDLILDDELTLAYELRQFKLDPNKIQTGMYVPEMSVDFEMAFSKQTPDSLVQQLRDGLAAIKTKGLYREIMQWHELPEPEAD
jgi:polar amino acid transport system substrate-binding protein